MDLKDYIWDIVNILILTRCDLTSETPSLNTQAQKLITTEWRTGSGGNIKLTNGDILYFSSSSRAPHNMDLVVIKSVPASLLRIRQISF